MEINDNDKSKLRNLHYDSLIEKCIKKSYLDVVSNPNGFVRGITPELSKDILLIKSGELPKTLDKTTLNRIKYICEYSINKTKNKVIPNEYQSAYAAVQELLKGS